MTYISIALSAEGPTDEAFLWPIVYRTAFSLASAAVIGETAYFLKRSASGNEERIRDVCKHIDEFDIFVIHADATRTAQPRIKQTIIDAIRDGAVARCSIVNGRLVGLITISEMESWALASPHAIAKALGYNAWPDRLTPQWRVAELETLEDPKRILKDAFDVLLGRSFDKESLSEALEAVAGGIPLEILDALPSYRQFREDLRACLVMLRAAR